MSIQIRVVGLVASAIIASAASAQTAVEWKVSEGGNGHWYQFIRDKLLWQTARANAESVGGHLATITSEAENNFARSIMSPMPTAGYLGGYRDGSGWHWITGETWSFTDWNPGEPNGGPGQVVWLENWNGLSGGWNDHPSSTDVFEGVQPSLREWSADCNGDGIVDYGQILRGELEDLNANGVPDICETSITSVLPPSVPSQGGATITIRGNGFPANPTVLVGGAPATNVVRESLTRITATSPAVLPGMKSVSVGDFTLPDGIYIRPECGSDLDQNGVVDTGDISIILLDFGPCYEPPAALAAPAPTPLLADEPAQKPVQR